MGKGQGDTSARATVGLENPTYDMEILMSRTIEQFEIARRSLAGGVSASTRVNRAIGRPMFIDRAEGCRVWDLDGKEYLDLCTSHGATLMGHGDVRVKAAVL